MAYHFNGQLVTDGLVLCLDGANLKSYSGTGTDWVDRSGLSIPATLQNSGSGTVSFSNGYSVYSPADMTATAGHYLINHATISALSTQVSLECWFYISVFYAKRMIPLSPRTTETGSPIGFSVDSGIFRHEINTTNGWVTGSVSSALATTGSWICISQTTDDANKLFKTYLNGVQIASVTFAGTPNSGGGLLIGKGFYAGTVNFNGRIGVVRYYNRTLSASEILQNFNATKGRYGL